MNLGKKIKQRRLELSMTQMELAKKIGRDQSSITAYEQGNRAPKIPILMRIAEVLNVPVGYFLEEQPR